MTTKRNDDSERIRNEASIQSASLTTTGTAMLLGLLAAAEAHQKQANAQPADTGDRHAQPDNAANATQSSAAVHDVAANVIPHTDNVDHHAAESNAIQLPQQHATGDAGPHLEPTPEIHHVSASPAAHADTVSGEMPAETPPAFGNTSSTSSIEDAFSSLSSTLSDQIHQIVAQVLPDPGALASSINDTVDHITSVVLSVPENAASSLVSAAFDAPSPLPAHDVIDTAPLGALPFDLAIPVGLVGQPHADGHDPHDGAFSAIGIHGF